MYLLVTPDCLGNEAAAVVAPSVLCNKCTLSGSPKAGQRRGRARYILLAASYNVLTAREVRCPLHYSESYRRHENTLCI